MSRRGAGGGGRWGEEWKGWTKKGEVGGGGRREEGSR